MMCRDVPVLVPRLVARGGRDDGRAGAQAGRDLFAEVGGLACQQETDADIAPSLRRIWATEATLGDGSTVTVDEDYVRRSITDPGADVVERYGANMPTSPVGDAEVDRLVEWEEIPG